MSKAVFFPVHSFVLAQIISFIFHSTYNITIYFDLLLIVKGFPFQSNFVGGYQIEVYQSNKNTRKNIFYYLSNITPPPPLSLAITEEVRVSMIPHSQAREFLWKAGSREI